MQINKTIIFWIFVFTFCVSAESYSQTFGSNLNKDSNTEITTSKQEGFKPDVKVSLGTSFTSFAPGYNSFGTFIAPEISMPVSKKVEISFGMGYSSMFCSSPGESTFGSNQSSYGNVYFSGTYHVNEKISVRGTGYKTFLLNPSNFSEGGNSNQFDFSSQGAILDVEYRVTDHFKINASFHYREQNYPDYFFGSPQGNFNNNQNTTFGGIDGFNPGF
jgi:hypothetical protein